VRAKTCCNHFSYFLDFIANFQIHSGRQLVLFGLLGLKLSWLCKLWYLRCLFYK
jgi:hypothetical protein